MITAALFLLHAFAAPAFTSGQSIETITLDPNSYRSISPYIYGVNFPDWSTMNFGITVARQGGNRLTAYNWETNASNAGRSSTTAKRKTALI